MKLSVALMAHPKRAQFVVELQEQLPDATVVWDRHGDRWETGRRSMLAHDKSADFHLVVQDDAILCPDFLPGVEVLLAHVPQVPVSFYTGAVRPYGEAVKRAVARAHTAGRCFLRMPGPLWGVAIAIPTSRIRPMIAACDQWPGILNYDMRLATYFARERIDCWYTLPSLVDHRIGPGNPSLVRGRSSASTRVAHEWIGGRSPLEIDWTRGALNANEFHLLHGRPKAPREGSHHMTRIADRRIYGRDALGRRILLAAPGQRISAALAALAEEETSAGAHEPLAGGTPQPEDEVVDYSKLKQPELKGRLDRRGIVYPKGPISNKKLVELLRASD